MSPPTPRFAAALSKGEDYTDQPEGLATEIHEAIGLTTTVCRNAWNHGSLLREQQRLRRPSRSRSTRSPTRSRDRAQALELHRLVGRENVLIKIPATLAGLAAITDTIAAGVSVNVTLIFSAERYREVMDAYISGLEKADAAGHDLTKIHSVASLFVSRVDTEVDKRLDALGRQDLRGKAAIANSQISWALFNEVFAGERWDALAAKGANKQRPLWASTGTKDPAYPDTKYVSELIAPGCVNTMPEKTMMAYADHGEPGRPLEGAAQDGQAVLDAVSAAGVDMDDVFQTLETRRWRSSSRHGTS